MARRDEQGAVVPLVAVMLTVLVGLTALTVDIGMQRVARTDMQTVADMVALDLSRELDGRTADEIGPTLQAAADRSVARNPDTVGDDVTVEPELGTLSAAGVFTAASGSTVPTAVRVTAATSVAFQFTSGSGGASRTAVGVARAQGCYKLGSWGARLATSSASAQLIARILTAHGIGASVGAATYQGMVGATVDAAALASRLGLASPEALGSASVTLTALLDAAAEVIGTSGASSGQVDALDTVRADLGALGGQQVELANLFTIGSGAGAGLSAALDLADLVIGGVLVADGNSAASVDLSTGLPGVGSMTSSVGLVQAARTACGFAGSTPNSSNQVAVTSEAALTEQDLTLGIPGIAAVSVESSTPLSLTVTTASATSTLDAVTCGTSSRSATVSTAGGLLGATLVVPLSITITLGFIPIEVDVVARATLTPSGTPGAVTITVPSQSYNTPYSNGGAQAQLPAATLDPVGSVAGISGALLTQVLNGVMSSVVNPLVSGLNANVLGPLSDLAGLRTSGADVLLLDRPSCTTPALRG